MLPLGSAFKELLGEAVEEIAEMVRRMVHRIPASLIEDLGRFFLRQFLESRASGCPESHRPARPEGISVPSISRTGLLGASFGLGTLGVRESVCSAAFGCHRVARGLGGLWPPSQGSFGRLCIVGGLGGLRPPLAWVISDAVLLMVVSVRQTKGRTAPGFG